METEVKELFATEVKELIEAQGRAFEEFKRTNDEVIARKAEGKAVSELEARADRINEELSRLDAAIAELSKKANRPDAGADSARRQHSKAWSDFVRKGVEDGLAELEQKAWNEGTSSDGGYAVPIEQDREIMRLLKDLSPMRQICREITVSTPDYRKLVNIGGAAGGWVGETDTRSATNTSSFAQLTPDMGEVYAFPQVTQRALDDLFYDVEGELNRDIAEIFAEKEGDAFLNGAGTNQSGKAPKGLLAATTAATADSSRSFGTVQYVKTGVAADFTASNPADKLLDLIYACKAGYRQNGKFLCNSTTLATMRKWKDGQSNYLWQPSAQAGQPSTLFGYPVVTDENTPSVGANKFPVVFGDFFRAFWIVDRVGIRVLRDPYTNKPYVGFYATKRTGTMLADSCAVKFLKCEA